MNQKHSVTVPGLGITFSTGTYANLAIGAVNVRMIDGQFVANPTIEQMYSSSLDLIYVGNDKDMLMIEGSADQIPEDDFIRALEFGHQAIQPVISAIRELMKLAGKTK